MNNEQLTLFFNQVYHGRTFFIRSRDFGIGKVLPINPLFIQELVGTDMLSDDIIVKYNNSIGSEREAAKCILVDVLHYYLRTRAITPDRIGTIVSLYLKWEDKHNRTKI